jgi:signal transduction histidine kinase
MRWSTRIFDSNSRRIKQTQHFLFVSTLVIIISLVYYSLQFYWISIFDNFPLASSLVIWEFSHDLVGSLMYIPLIYAAFFLSWRNGLIIWVLTMLIIMPHVINLENNSALKIIINIALLSSPFFVASYVGIEVDWWKKEKRALAEKERERATYLSQVFKAQEDERKRVAREIHDDPIQRLAVIASNVQILSSEIELDSLPNIKEKAESIKDSIITVSQDLRRITLDLRPTVLDDLGLVPALRWMVEGFRKDTGIDAQVEITGKVLPMDAKYSVNIFRIVQEALTNIKKHSKATRVRVTIQFAPNRIKVRIQDNGCGFILPKSSSELTSSGKLGLIGMQQRTQFIEGTIKIQSMVGDGTTISMNVGLKTSV